MSSDTALQKTVVIIQLSSVQVLFSFDSAHAGKMIILYEYYLTYKP